MKNSIQFTIVIVCLMGLVAAASAKEGNPGGSNRNGNHNSGANNSGNSNNNNQGYKPFGGKVTKFNKDVFQQLSHQDHGHHAWNHGKPDAPYVRPQGDGRVPTPDVPTDTGTMTLLTPPNSTPPGNTRPGYVWTNGHWERVKATGSSVHTPSNSSPATGRPGGSGYAPNHGYGVNPPPVANNGTITVTDTPGSSRDNTIYGTGPGLNEILSIHDPRVLWEYRPGAGFTAPQYPSRDHRTPNGKNER